MAAQVLVPLKAAALYIGRIYTVRRYNAFYAANISSRSDAARHGYHQAVLPRRPDEVDAVRMFLTDGSKRLVSTADFMVRELAVLEGPVQVLPNAPPLFSSYRVAARVPVSEVVAALSKKLEEVNRAIEEGRGDVDAEASISAGPFQLRFEVIRPAPLESDEMLTLALQELAQKATASRVNVSANAVALVRIKVGEDKEVAAATTLAHTWKLVSSVPSAVLATFFEHTFMTPFLLLAPEELANLVPDDTVAAMRDIASRLNIQSESRWARWGMARGWQ